MIDSNISDQVFKDSLEVALKGRGVKKDKRIAIINNLMHASISSRDSLIDMEERNTREYIEAKKESKKIRSEFEEQCEFVHWFKKTYPGVVIMSIRNGGSRTPRERSDQIREGLHPGAADLYIPSKKIWIEFKKTKGGILSEEQKIFRAYVCDVCCDNWMLAEGFEDGKVKIMELIRNKT